MIFTIIEIFYILITVLVIGYIFSGYIKLPPKKDDFIPIYNSWFDWKLFKFSILVAAPAIILHEMGHKFIAILMGLEAHYEIWGMGLIIGLVLKIFNSGFMLLAPGYVTFTNATKIQIILTGAAGPFINLILWIGAFITLKYKKNLTRLSSLFLVYTSQINKWLFIFNMLPIPPLDGSKIILPLLGINL
ncbi:MAG TPA: hypothetical protein VJB89_00525 [Candidatus Nanoarchaeia archaeon]|nr:hypothetical protein [Candidatus Nanoarchaeia archaeon]